MPGVLGGGLREPGASAPQERPSIPYRIPQRHPGNSILRLKIPAADFLRPLLPFPQVIPAGAARASTERGKQMPGMDVPTRPPGLRLLARNTNANEVGGGARGAWLAQARRNVGPQGVHAARAWDPVPGTALGPAWLIDNMSLEQQQQAFLPQLLLLLGSKFRDPLLADLLKDADGEQRKSNSGCTSYV